MIESVVGLRKDGNQQPQFFILIVKYADQGEGYLQTTISGTEAHLRKVLADGVFQALELRGFFSRSFPNRYLRCV